jgi:hypothetical protein
MSAKGVTIVIRPNRIAAVAAPLLSTSGAFLAACAMSVAATSGTIPRSTAVPAERAIDAVCDIFNARPKLIRDVKLARLDMSPGHSEWRLDDDAAVAKLQTAGTIVDTFADVFTRDGKIVYASQTRADVTGDGGGTHDYCYINARLARASSEELDATVDQSISRKCYYDAHGNLFADTGTIVRDLQKRRNAIIPTTAPYKIELPAYMTPSALPFYAAYRAALKGTLKKI